MVLEESAKSIVDHTGASSYNVYAFLVPPIFRTKTKILLHSVLWTGMDLNLQVHDLPFVLLDPLPIFTIRAVSTQRQFP